MKREEKEEMNRDEKEVKQLRLFSLFTICTDGRSTPQSSMMTLFMFKIVKRMKICQKQKQKCKKQLWKRKSCLAGPGRLLPLCTPPPPLYKVGQNDIYSFALLSHLCSTFCLFILFFLSFFSSKTTFSCLLSSDSKAPYLRNVQREGGAVGIFCRVGCCWILSGHRLIRTTHYILSL